MFKIISNILLLFCCLFLFSCKKRDCTRIFTKGSVYDETTHQPLADATVYLLAQKSSCFTCQPGIITEFKTNEKGEFFIDYDGDAGFSYFMKAAKEKYFESTTLATLNECSKNYKKNRSLLYVIPEGYLKLHIKNTSNSDEFGLGNYVHSFYGADVDTIVTVIILGNSNNSIYYYVIKNNESTTYSFDIYCPAFDTTTFNINY